MYGKLWGFLIVLSVTHVDDIVFVTRADTSTRSGCTPLSNV